MKRDEKRTAVCPLCGQVYHGVPALSREDDKTPVCTDCGTRQALSALGVKAEEQEEILRIMHRHRDGTGQS